MYIIVYYNNQTSTYSIYYLLLQFHIFEFPILHFCDDLQYILTFNIYQQYLPMFNQMQQ